MTVTGANLHNSYSEYKTYWIHTVESLQKPITDNRNVNNLLTELYTGLALLIKLPDKSRLCQAITIRIQLW